MENFEIKDPPEYSDVLRMLESTDPNHADTFNALFEQLINNDASLKKLLEKLKEEATQSAAGLMSAKDKKKLDDGDTKTLEGKSLSDLQNYNNLQNRPTIPAAYTHPTTAGNKHIPAGGSSGRILRWSAAGTAVWGSDNNTTYGMATASASGLVSTTTQTFAGAKTFSGAVTMNSTVRAANNGRMVALQSSAPSDTGMLWAW